MHISSSLVISAIALAASAQTAQQNASAAAIAAMIPACARPCDDSAITQVGCGLTDYACHCAHGTQLAALIPTCLTSNSNCTAADLQSMPFTFISFHFLQPWSDVKGPQRLI